MNAPRGKRGQPLAFFAGLLVLWVAGRALVWTLPFERPADAAETQAAGEIGRVAQAPARAGPPRPRGADGETTGENRPAHVRPGFPAPPDPSQSGWPLPAGQPGPILTHQAVAAEAMGEPPGTTGHPSFPVRTARADPAVGNGIARPPAALPRARKPARWSGYAWLFARDDGDAGALGPALRPASYGASQAGAVLKYRFAPGSATSAFAYARASKALIAGGEEALALGVGKRIADALPVTLHAEARAVLSGGATRIQPAVLLVTELPEFRPTPDVSAEVYGQAGYVGGAFDTPFADGQARLQYALASQDSVSVRIGAGAWAGAQQGAGRVDVGPSVTVSARPRGVPLRLSVDYRLRVAGEAEPGDGLALTLSSGF